MIQNLSISRKLTACFALLSVMFLCVALFVFHSLDEMATANAQVRAAAALQADAQSMMGHVIEQQSAVRGYTILGKPEFVETYAKNRRALAETAARYRATAQAPRQVALLDVFLREVAAWHATRLERTIALARDPETRRMAQEMAGVKQLTGMRDAMKAMDAFQAEERVRLEAAQVGADRVARISVVAGGAIAVMLAGLLGWLMTKAIARPIRGMTDVMGHLAGGDHAVTVPGDGRRDEIGEMARAVLVFRDAAIAKGQADAEQARAVAQVAAGLGRLAAADLTATLGGLPAGYDRIAADFNAAVAALGAALAAVSRSTIAIRNGAGEISHASDDLSRRTEQQAAALEETAAAMEQITTTVRQTARGAADADGLVGEARGVAAQSGEVVRRAVAAMAEIERSSAEIAEIIGVIDGIAFQTNLLALNAGVEAARAGDAGKGFAVVAQEVRALAHRSAEAAKDVRARIAASGGQVAAGVALVDEAGVALGRISDRIGEIGGLVSGIATSAAQQATGLAEVNTAVTAMDATTQQNAAMVEQATAAARSLSAEAGTLDQAVARFRIVEAAPVALRRAA